MNLVQINERLKDLPMQVVQQYANGMNPEVPPYLALGELQRRELSQKQMATAQGAQQGPQPSIKEQVEQKAGLMQLQQMQQQQMAQQMQQPRGPMPTSEGTPQPVDQPEVAMAGGGLASVPVRSDMFEYASGGIIAFSGGGQSLNERAARQMEQKGSIYDPYFGVPEEERRRLKEEADLKSAQDFASGSLSLIKSNAQAMADSAQSRVTELEQNREELTRKFGPRMYEQALGRAQQAVDAATAKGSELVDRQTQTGQARIAAATPQFGSRFAAVNPADMMGSPVAGLPAAINKAAGPAPAAKPPRPAEKRPTAQPSATQPPVASGLPAALPQGPVQTGAPPAAIIPVSADRAEVEALMREQKRAAPTAQGVISDVNALMPAGMQEEAMKRLLGEQRARADARQAAYESSKPTGLQDFIRVMGQAGQSKGFSGLAPAYTALQQQRRADDLAMQKQQDELLTAIEGRGMAFDKDVFSARTGAMDKAQSLFGQSQKSILEAAAKKLEASQGRLDKEAQLNMQRDLKMFEVAQEERLKGMDLEQRERERKSADARSPAAKAAEFVALRQRARDLREKGQVAQADRLDAQAADMAAFGGGGQGGDRNPTPTDRLRAAQSILSDIDSTPEEKAMAKKEIASIMSGAKPGGGGAFTVTAGGKTYTFPTQEAANKFKAEAGVK
jgi:hypothetical protein